MLLLCRSFDSIFRLFPRPTLQSRRLSGFWRWRLTGDHFCWLVGWLPATRCCRTGQPSYEGVGVLLVAAVVAFSDFIHGDRGQFLRDSSQCDRFIIWRAERAVSL